MPLAAVLLHGKPQADLQASQVVLSYGMFLFHIQHI
jgi:hypothetical protein